MITPCFVSCGKRFCEAYGCARVVLDVEERCQELFPQGLAADSGPDYGDDRDPEDRMIEIVDRIKAIG